MITSHAQVKRDQGMPVHCHAQISDWVSGNVYKL